MGKIQMTPQHRNEFDPSGIEYTCSLCWKVCIAKGFKYCPQCGCSISWSIYDDPKYSMTETNYETL